MSWNKNSHGLPFLPGFTFPDLTKSAFHRCQTLEYKNGFRVPRHPIMGTGKDLEVTKPLIQPEMSDFVFESVAVPSKLTGEDQEEGFIPFFVALDKKVLRFYAYFQENVLFSPVEDYRVRPVVVYYYLEDDTMSIVEPKVQNSGLSQGMRIKRQRLPKAEGSLFYMWNDLNVAMDLVVYGVKYRIVHCDIFTQEFLEKKGIVMNSPESMPVDPYIKRRENPQPTFTTPCEMDRMFKFLTLDRMVLRFFALWEDADSLQGKTRPVTIQYFLADDTMEIRMVQEPNSGRDPYPVLMRRQTLPKKIKLASATFPSCVLEVSSEEVDEYYSPKDLQLGRSIKLLSRSFLLYDCDAFTKEYYEKNHPQIEMKTIKLQKKINKHLERKKEVPPYNGYGSLEDSLQNCLSLVPKRPKQDVLKMLEKSNMVLRYSAKLVSKNPDNDGRLFVISYFLSNDMISIFENPTRNSGIISGKFLEKTRVPKPGSTANNPQFYSPADFVIGATVQIFSHRFLLTDADLYVLSYLEANADNIPPETLESVRRKLNVDGANDRAWAQIGNEDQPE